MKKAFSVIMVSILVICIVLSPALFEHNHVYAIPYDANNPLQPGDSVTPCPVCGQTYASVMVLYSVAPTCTEEGSLRYSCPGCGGTNTVAYLALGHSWQYAGVGQAATCTQSGWDNYSCSRCGATAAGTIAALGHDYKEEITKEASCEEEGVKTFTCSRCADHYDEAIEALGHDFVHEEKEASCTEDGYKKDVCQRCGKEEEEIIPAKGHVFSGKWTVEKEPGLFTPGLEYDVCKVCKEKITRTIPAKLPWPVIIGVVGVLGLIGYFVARVIKRKAAAGAAELAAKEAAKLGKPKIRTRVLLLCTGDEKLVEVLKKKSFFKVRTCKYDELKEKAEDAEPDIIIADALSDEMLGEISEAKKDAFKDINIGLIACKTLSGGGRKRLADMVRDEVIVDWVEEGESPYVAMVDLILPVIKPDLKSDETLKNVGTVADALGIPGISRIIEVYLAGKDIKETVEEEELGVSEDAAIIGDIASILGLEKVESVAGLVGDIDDIKAALDEEAGGYEKKKGKKAVKDIADVVSDLKED